MAVGLVTCQYADEIGARLNSAATTEIEEAVSTLLSGEARSWCMNTVVVYLGIRYSGSV